MSGPIEGLGTEGFWDCCAPGEDCLNGSNARGFNESVRKRKDEEHQEGAHWSTRSTPPATDSSTVPRQSPSKTAEFPSPTCTA